MLEAGTTVLCDRYAYSGVAYSVAVHVSVLFAKKREPFVEICLLNAFLKKNVQGLSFTWCLQADKGLLKPDVVYQIATEPSVCAKRHGYGKLHATHQLPAKQAKKQLVRCLCVLSPGNEVYERQHIQERVAEAYSLFHTADNWKVIQPCSADCLAASHQPSTEQHPEQAQRKTSAQEMSIDQSINSVTQQILEHLLPLLEHSSEHSEQVRPPLARLGDAVSW